MSLDNPTPVKQYRLGIVAAKNLDDPSFLPELIGGNVTAISHLYTNGACDLVARFAQCAGLPYTVFPLTGGRSLPWSTSRILENSDFVFIVADAGSKSAAKVVEECVAKGVKHRLVPFEPVSHWKQKVCQIQEILAAVDKVNVDSNETLKAISHVV